MYALIGTVFVTSFTYKNVKRSSGIALAGVRLTKVEPKTQVL